MIFPDVQLQAWLLKYPTIEVVKTTCIDCGNGIEANRPYLTKHYAGVTSAACRCGSRRSACSSSVARTAEENQSWSSVL